MFAKINSFGLLGLNAFSVDAEIEASGVISEMQIVGLADIAVKESKERMTSAFRTSKLPFPNNRIIINLAPADTKKSGSLHDLAIATAIMAVMGLVDPKELESSAFVGEVSLSGDIRSIDGVLPMALAAYKKGIKQFYCPYENAAEASVIEGLEVIPVKSLIELSLHFCKKEIISPAKRYMPSASQKLYMGLDFADVMGQNAAKKALEIAAAGSHNVLMIGAPGSGKSMLAKRLPTILPDMTFEESIETTNVHSISGIISREAPLVTERPFRNPHHTISPAGLAGGGSIPKPGEISIAHNGVLFLDELAEFDRKTLEILRQPLEDGTVTISRASGTCKYPCNVMLIAAMNPCPCGYYGHPVRECICSPNQVTKYLSKISAPLLDRLDLHVEVAPVEYDKISSGIKEESSESIRKRVQKAREIQTERFKGTGVFSNAGITSDILHKVCPTTDSANAFLKGMFEKMGLSARAYDRILKVARTVADLDGREVIDKSDISTAVQYRSLDRKYWSKKR